MECDLFAQVVLLQVAHCRGTITQPFDEQTDIVPMSCRTVWWD